MIEYLLTSMVIKRAIQIAKAKNAAADDDAPIVNGADTLNEAIDELKFVRPLVMAALRQPPGTEL
jgi:hypothetical protein